MGGQIDAIMISGSARISTSRRGERRLGSLGPAPLNCAAWDSPAARGRRCASSAGCMRVARSPSRVSLRTPSVLSCIRRQAGTGLGGAVGCPDILCRSLRTIADIGRLVWRSISKTSRTIMD